MNKNDYMQQLGLLALGSRLKRLSETCYQKSQSIYTQSGLDFDPSCFPVLRYLDSKKEASLIEIADALGISHAAVSQRISKLTRQKIIERRYPKKDKRTCLISLSKYGRKLVNELSPHWKIIQESLEEALGENAESLLHAIHVTEQVFANGSFENIANRKLKHMQSSQIQIVAHSKKMTADFAALNEEWLNMYFEVEPIDKKVLGNPEKYILAQGGEIWFACRGKQVLGCYALLYVDNDTVEFSKFAVTPSARGQQIGRTLMQHALSRAADRGAKKLILYTHSRLAMACALYRAVGFVTVPLSGASPYKRCDTFMQFDLSAMKAAKKVIAA